MSVLRISFKRHIFLYLYFLHLYCNYLNSLCLCSRVSEDNVDLYIDVFKEGKFLHFHELPNALDVQRSSLEMSDMHNVSPCQASLIALLLNTD